MKENKIPYPSQKIFSVDDARELAKWRLPKLVFDFVDGASGNESLSINNNKAYENIKLEPRVLINVEERSLKTKLLDSEYGLPFGFAPMGMCNLTWPNTDTMLAKEAIKNNIPICSSMAASTSLEKIYELSNGLAWFQLYIGQDEDFVVDLLNRAQDCGYKTIILTVDVPILARRSRDNRNGFDIPFRMSIKNFIDFATHPNWSLRTLYHGAPTNMNYVTSKSGKRFVRGESRGKIDWNTLKMLRDKWKGHLIVKGVMNEDDAIKIKNYGVNAIYISNHGGRQLDCAPPSINALPKIRQAVGNKFPLIIDSGIRSGSDILKALALGANFVMIGRPLMYGVGADSHPGLIKILQIIENELSTALGLVGLTDIKNVSRKILSKNLLENISYG